MFTINTQWALGKNGVRWDTENLSTAKSPTTTDEFIELAKNKLQEASKKQNEADIRSSTDDGTFRFWDSSVE